MLLLDYNHKEFYYLLRAAFEERRKELGLSYKNMAKLCGMTEAHLQNIAKGHIPINSFHTTSNLCHGHQLSLLIEMGKPKAHNAINLTYVWSADKDFYLQLGKGIAKTREGEKLSQLDAALKMGNINYQTRWSRIELAHNEIKFSTLAIFLAGINTRLIVEFKP